MRPTLETHRQRLQAACRRISEIPVEILMADDAGLSVHAGVAALASGRFMVLSSEFAGRDADFEMNALVCHELAHLVSRPGPQENKINIEALKPVVAKPWRSWPAHCGPLLWAGHDYRFIRTLVHIAYRLSSQGFLVDREASFSHRTYGLSSLSKYATALADEPSRLDWIPIAEVLATPMPQSFQKLWTHDVVRSLKRLLLKRSPTNVERS